MSDWMRVTLALVLMTLCALRTKLGARVWRIRGLRHVARDFAHDGLARDRQEAFSETINTEHRFARKPSPRAAYEEVL